jgi:phage terminase large subunit GpA-like protein
MAELVDYSAGEAAFVEMLVQARKANLRRPPKLSLSQWAASYAVLSPETSAQTGRFRAYAYQVGMLDAVTDSAVTQVTVMKSARVGYTKCIDHVVGYFIHQDPSPMLVVQPTVEDAEDYSSTEVEPMLRDTEVLSDIAGDLKARGSKQKLLKRVFRNGASVSFVGANSRRGSSSLTKSTAIPSRAPATKATRSGSASGDHRPSGTARSYWDRRPR